LRLRGVVDDEPEPSKAGESKNVAGKWMSLWTWGDKIGGVEGRFSSIGDTVWDACKFDHGEALSAISDLHRTRGWVH